MTGTCHAAAGVTCLRLLGVAGSGCCRFVPAGALATAVPKEEER
jgi:hypothetical protein